MGIIEAKVGEVCSHSVMGRQFWLLIGEFFSQVKFFIVHQERNVFGNEIGLKKTSNYRPKRR